jgi:Amt family ammonium transporter
VDDPVQIIPVHFIGGLIGTFMTGLFDTKEGLFYGKGGSLLGGQVVGIIVYIGFPAIIFGVVLVLLKGLGLFRVSA